MKKTYFVIILLVVCWGLWSETHIEGGAVDGFWVISGSPYYIDGDIFINDSETLTIQSGVEIIFSDNYQLNVSGRLLAVGTLMDSISWSVADTTGFSNIEIPDGGWGGIRFDYLCDDNEMSELGYCRLEYGKAVGELDIEVTGGAVFVDSCSNVVISNCTLINNTAVWGGAIACDNEASPTISNNTITNNITYNFTNHNGCGAGIFCNNGSCPIIEGNLIADNISDDNGGGICAFYGAAPQILNNIIRDNTTEEGGGIIFGTSGMGTISGNIITGNSASFDGGGLCFSGAFDAVVENNYLAGNSSFWGGGMSFFKSSTISVTDNVIENNTATIGGGISDTEESNFGINISGNSVRNNEAIAYGGGVSWSCSGLEIDSANRNSVYENNAMLGDDLFLPYFTEEVYLDTFTVMIPTSAHVSPANSLSFDIMNSIYTQIDADIYVSPEGDDGNSGLSAEEPFRTINQAIRLIYPGDGELTIHLGEGIYDNQTDGENFPVMGINHVNIAGAGAEETIIDAEGCNSAFYYQGIEAAKLSDLTAKNTSPVDNMYYWEIYSSAICARNSNLILENLILCDNDGGTAGGGLNVLDSSECNLENVKITGNMAEMYGGGIYCGSDSKVTLNKCEVTGNQVLVEWSSSGPAICCGDSSEVVVTNSTLADNTSLAGGSIFIAENCTLRMVNSICRNEVLHEVFIEQYAGFDNPVMIAYSNITAGIEGIAVPNGAVVNWEEGNIDAEPEFVDPEIGDYELALDSPCVDSGIDWLEWNEEVLVDLDADDYYGIAPDMGCYEYGMSDVDDDGIIPADNYLMNYPNPFNPETTIAFYVPQAGKVELGVYNVKGQKVKTLINEKCEAGEQQVIWQGTDSAGRKVSTGVYFFRLDIEGQRRQLRKSVLMK